MYIYLDREEAKKGVTLVKAVLEKRNEKYQKEYVEFNGDDIPHFITYIEETDSIREATEEEKLARKQITLAENEVIIDNQIVAFDMKYQKVINGKIVDKTIKELIEESIITLDDVKKRKREELKVIREEKIAENIEVHGSLFQVREKDLENFEDVARAIRRGKRQLTDRRIWVLADNSVKEFTYAQLLDVLDERAERKDKIFTQFATLSMQLEKCDTVESIENIKF